MTKLKAHTSSYMLRSSLYVCHGVNSIANFPHSKVYTLTEDQKAAPISWETKTNRPVQRLTREKNAPLKRIESQPHPHETLGRRPVYFSFLCENSSPTPWPLSPTTNMGGGHWPCFKGHERFLSVDFFVTRFWYQIFNWCRYGLDRLWLPALTRVLTPSHAVKDIRPKGQNCPSLAHQKIQIKGTELSLHYLCVHLSPLQSANQKPIKARRTDSLSFPRNVQLSCHTSQSEIFYIILFTYLIFYSLRFSPIKVTRD